MEKVDLSSSAYCLMHPARLKILQLLKEKPSTISEISNGTGLSRNLVAYHMSFLETHNFLVNEYKLEKREGRSWASRQYSHSAKVDEVISWIVERLKRIKHDATH